MAKDIEEFLKMAAERRKAAQAPQNQGQPAAGRAPTPPPPPVQPARTPAGQRPPAERPPPASRGTASKPPAGKQPSGSNRRESVTEHVQTHLQNKRLVEHAAGLGKDIEQVDDKLEAHLHQKFDHDVGRLGVQSTGAGGPRRSSTQPIPAPAAAIRALLQNQQNVQQAIILGEVLRRPEW